VVAAGRIKGNTEHFNLAGMVLLWLGRGSRTSTNTETEVSIKVNSEGGNPARPVGQQTGDLTADHPKAA